MQLSSKLQAFLVEKTTKANDRKNHHTMTQQETIYILKSRFEKIQASFDVAIAYLDAEEIHAFRVEVKKLRAFLHLAPSEVKVKLPGRLHIFYQMVGKIRNLQLQEQRIRDAIPHQSCLLQTYLNLLAIEVAGAIRRAKEFAAKRLSIPVEERQLLNVLPNRLTEDAICKFTRTTVERLQTIGDSPHPIDDDSFHSFRKSLKDLLYNHAYIEKEAVHILPAILSDGKESVSALTELLGQFQDLRSGLALLQPIYIDQVMDVGEKKLLEGIKALWEKDKATIKDEILSTLQPVIHQNAACYAADTAAWK
jgi:CHAD domain-containing protein